MSGDARCRLTEKLAGRQREVTVVTNLTRSQQMFTFSTVVNQVIGSLLLECSFFTSLLPLCKHGQDSNRRTSPRPNMDRAPSVVLWKESEVPSSVHAWRWCPDRAAQLWFLRLRTTWLMHTYPVRDHLAYGPGVKTCGLVRHSTCSFSSRSGRAVNPFYSFEFVPISFMHAPNYSLFVAYRYDEIIMKNPRASKRVDWQCVNHT